MYNRYIPQPDGSYRRNTVADHVVTPVQKRPHKEPLPPEPICEVPAEASCPPVSAPPQPPKVPPCRKHRPKEPGGIGSFFRNLLPRELDTADLLIIILLLLMAGDKDEDQANALLTLALYFFM